MRKRIAYSQNFLQNKSLVSELVKKSSITDKDIVYEIGAGQGIITEELLKKCKKVVAFEIDTNLFEKLLNRFEGNKSLQIRNEDFLTASLHDKSYKVFSNIPFNITADVIRKITQSANPSNDSYLIVQKEASEKFIGKPYVGKNSQIAILLKPWFEIEVTYKFSRNDFFPRPQVDSVLLRIKKLEVPFINEDLREIYLDFVVYTFNQFKPNVIEGLSSVFGKNTILNISKTVGFSPNSKPSDLDFKQWLSLFEYYLKIVKKQNFVQGSYRRLLEQQKRLKKIHRTREDRDWKRF